LFHHYKPDPEVYRGAVELLATSAERVMLVAAHPLDLRAAQAQGLRTAFVSRPLEHGPKEPPKDEPGDEFDFAVKSLEELAQKLESSA
jgi:2-haloacid dehalogenase